MNTNSAYDVVLFVDGVGDFVGIDVEPGCSCTFFRSIDPIVQGLEVIVFILKKWQNKKRKGKKPEQNTASKLQVEQCGRQCTHSAYVCYAFIESLNPSYIIHQHIYLSVHWKLCNLMHAPHPFERRGNACRRVPLIILASSSSSLSGRVCMYPGAAGIHNNNQQQ